jgi:hypothetical protein
VFLQCRISHGKSAVHCVGWELIAYRHCLNMHRTGKQCFHRWVCDARCDQCDEDYQRLVSTTCLTLVRIDICHTIWKTLNSWKTGFNGWLLEPGSSLPISGCVKNPNTMTSCDWLRECLKGRDRYPLFWVPVSVSVSVDFIDYH